MPLSLRLKILFFLSISISILNSELLLNKAASEIEAYLSLSHASEALEINSRKKTSFSLYKECATISKIFPTSA